MLDAVVPDAVDGLRKGDPAGDEAKRAGLVALVEA